MLNHTQLISNGYEFTEVPLYPLYDFTSIAPTSAGPTPSVRVSTQADVATERVNPLGGSIIAHERQDTTAESMDTDTGGLGVIVTTRPAPPPLPAIATFIDEQERQWRETWIEALERHELESTSYTPREVRETRHTTLSATNARQTEAALPTIADMSSPQTHEAGTTRQPAESASHAFSSGQSTAITGDLRHRVTTRPGRRPKRGLPGRTFEQDLKNVQERLRSEGADVGAVERLRSEIFLDGKITKAALRTDMTLDQRRRHEGWQKYMLLLEVVERPDSSRVHRCVLCPPWAPVEFKNPRDSLRHLYKDHFGLAVVCSYW